VENIRVSVEILGDVIVAGLNEYFICWELEGNLLVTGFETNSGENLSTGNKNSG
jgi:hypothetical protein